MSGKIYIIGHKSPDLDSVAAAIAYAYFKNHIESADTYLPAIAGSVNKETEYALKRFNFDMPELINEISDKTVILVDHNEAIQSANGIEYAKISEIVDHHKVDFRNHEPIRIDIRPWGATSSIIADKFFDNKIGIEKDLAGLLLSAILVDTVIARSPTCTPVDVQILDKLAPVSGIQDWKEYGLELFKIKSSVNELGAAGIIGSDFKDFNFKQGKVGIGQVETVDLREFAEKEDEIMAELKNKRSAGGYLMVMLFITDIINEGSKFLVAADDYTKFEEAMGGKLENGKTYIEGIISRKKQVAPKFAELLDK